MCVRKRCRDRSCTPRSASSFTARQVTRLVVLSADSRVDRAPYPERDHRGDRCHALPDCGSREHVTSLRSRRVRQRIFAPEQPNADPQERLAAGVDATPDPERIDAFEPDYNCHCIVCGEKSVRDGAFRGARGVCASDVRAAYLRPGGGALSDDVLAETAMPEYFFRSVPTASVVAGASATRRYGPRSAGSNRKSRVCGKAVST